MKQSADFFVRSAVMETTRSYMGSLMTFLVTSAETENRFVLLELRMKPGNEPPPHLHYDQDEVYYILEGELEVYCMGEVRTVRAGETIFLPGTRRTHSITCRPPSGSSPCCNRAVRTGTVWTVTLKQCQVRPLAWNYLRAQPHTRSPIQPPRSNWLPSTESRC